LRRVAYAAALLVCLTFLLAGAGATYQWVANVRDRQANPPPGKMIDVGGFRMHLYCVGQGSPAVILESGLSDTWLHWYKVQPQVAQFTRVCSYDRAGLGWSDPSPRPRTSRVIAEELHTLLKTAEVPPPYVLVGHSMGGLNIRMYASLYPSEVRGMVLVDASHPEQNRRLPNMGNPWLQAMLWQKRLMPFGIPRLLGWCGQGMDQVQPAFRSFDCTVQQKLGWFAEEDSLNESLRQVGAIRSLGDMPLVVLSHDPGEEQTGFGGPQRTSLEASWAQMQEELARLSSRGSRIIARGSGHQVHRERPDLVIGAIRDVVTQYRNAHEQIRFTADVRSAELAPARALAGVR
jgi:pimeloyl-ACP methyl ester carboxylesterase